jgi:hypothetical protein
VEGQGEVQAMPNLCARIANYLGAWAWFVDPEPVRQPRSKIVDESVASPHRPAATAGLKNAIALARARPADAVLVLCDSDDDCAATWGPSAAAILADSGGAVMAVREYEAWLLYGYITDRKINIDAIRDAKGRMRDVLPGYKPTTHQLEATRALNLDLVRARSDSFDKLVRSLAKIFEVAPPPRGNRD